MEVSRELTNSEYSEGLIEVSTFFPVSYSEYDIGLVDFESRYYLPTFIAVDLIIAPLECLILNRTVSGCGWRHGILNMTSPLIAECRLRATG